MESPDSHVRQAVVRLGSFVPGGDVGMNWCNCVNRPENKYNIATMWAPA